MRLLSLALGALLLAACSGVSTDPPGVVDAPTLAVSPAPGLPPAADLLEAIQNPANGFVSLTRTASGKFRVRRTSGACEPLEADVRAAIWRCLFLTTQ